MIGHRAVIGMSLACALLACAFTAQSAFAVAAKNTTLVTCTQNGGAKDFTDAHCDNKGAGNFGHTLLESGVKWGTNITNAKTKNNTTEAAPAIFKWTNFGVKHEVTCTVVTGTGLVGQAGLAEKEHNVAGSAMFNFTKCTVNKPAGCKVEEPIVLTGTTQGVEGLGALKNEMGIEFIPTESKGGTLVPITVIGCIVKGTTNLTGTAIATGTPAPTEKHSGVTTVFTNAMTKETLQAAGNPAELSSSTTMTRTSDGAPLSHTTVT
jgi:hypothetical protein